jgi:sugar phosphate isomerase/epimerase
MKLAFSKPTNSAREVTNVMTQFGPVGFAGLQLKGERYMPYLDNPGAFQAQWGKFPGSTSALIAWRTLDGPDREVMQRIFALGRKIGTERIVLCHGVAREGLSADELRRFAREMSELGRQAADQGLKLSLHNHYNNPVMHRPDFEVFFDAVRPGTVGLTVDTAHLAKSGVTDFAELIRSFAPVIDNFHLKGFADGQFKVLGTGGLDFAPIFAAIRDIQYDGWVAADEENGADMLGAMRQCHQFLKSGLAGKLAPGRKP